MNENNLIGYIIQGGALIGTISEVGNLVGTVSSNGSLIGTASSSMVEHIDEYEGPYIATPTADIQTLLTQDKKMIDDVTINATPISDVRTVDTDGYTITVL